MAMNILESNLDVGFGILKARFNVSQGVMHGNKIPRSSGPKMGGDTARACEYARDLLNLGAK